MAINDRQGDGHGNSVNHDPRSRQSDDQMSADGASPAVARAAATFTALVRPNPRVHGFPRLARRGRSTVTAAVAQQSASFVFGQAAPDAGLLAAGQRRQGRCSWCAPLPLVARVGYTGLGQAVADGGVHRGLLGVALWAVLSEARPIDIASASAASPASGSPRRTRCPRYASSIRRHGAVASPVRARFTRPRQMA
jgi:hypothetical protein